MGLVRRQLAELAGAHLIIEHVLGRFTLHDLLRAYATELACAGESQAEREQALRRTLDHYLHTAHGAALLMHPRWELIILNKPAPGVIPEEHTSYAEVLTWFEAEHPVLIAAVEAAAANGHSTHAWQIPEALNEFFNRLGNWHSWMTAQHTALSVARHTCDVRGQACAHRALGRALSWYGHFDEAHGHLQQAIDLFSDLADLISQADTHNMVAIVFEQQGRPTEALPHAQRALELSMAAGHLAGRARALNSIGWSHILLGSPQQGIASCEQALAFSRESGDRRTEAHILDDLGYAHHQLGRHTEAIAYFEQALVVERELGDLYGRTWALDRLGDAHYATNDEVQARKAWLEALDILDDLGLVRTGIGAGYPDADQIRTKLGLLI